VAVWGLSALPLAIYNIIRAHQVTITETHGDYQKKIYAKSYLPACFRCHGLFGQPGRGQIGVLSYVAAAPVSSARQTG
jgi:cytochrome c553